jgi:hypothetical protein
MARKKQAADPGVQDALAGLGNVLLDGDVPDWSALDSFALGELIAVLGPLDAGVMIRSSERGQSRSVGVFVGGQSQWTTCRDQRELLAILEAAQTTLDALLSRHKAPTPTEAGKKRAKRS